MDETKAYPFNEKKLVIMHCIECRRSLIRCLILIHSFLFNAIFECWSDIKNIEAEISVDGTFGIKIALFTQFGHCYRRLCAFLYYPDWLWTFNEITSWWIAFITWYCLFHWKGAFSPLRRRNHYQTIYLVHE